ncbi:MAG TPA: pyridoxal phosphate-dependent aminotransferase [Terriglobales bacterium]|jgi:aminotransferase|nr:pyridoxal phosphate-dependent aminotransferase [Terriglobales bacterium]
MSIGLSRRSARIEQAEIRSMSIECERLGGINLAQGVCDTPVPLAVREEAHRGIEEGVNSYTRFDGLAQLREAIAEKLCSFNAIQANPETDIIVSSGSTGAFYCACLALLDPGDEVILFEPYYGYHVNTVLAVEAQPRYVRLHPPGWSFSPEELEGAVTPRTKAILVNTPANPSGKVFTRSELETLAEFATRHDLFVFTDEIYEHFIYDGRSHISPASIEGLEERTITISGFSKTLSITGWRIGYSVSARQWAQRIGYMNDLVYVCAPAPLQYGVALGLPRLDAAFYRGLTEEYSRKRQQLCTALKDAGLNPYIPQGAYYVLADVSSLPGSSSKEKAMFLLRRSGVASVPGEAFFQSAEGKNIVRFCFAKPDDALDEACRRLEAMHAKLQAAESIAAN